MRATPSPASGLQSPGLPVSRSPGLPAAPELWSAITARLAQGDKAGAEPLLKDLLYAEPSHVPALVALGRMYADRAEWASARQQCMLALARDALCVPAHYLMAQIHESQGQLDAALAAYRRALYLDDGFVPGMLGMANVCRRMGRAAESQRYYRNALKHLDQLPPATPIPDADGATAAELTALVARQLEAIAIS